MATSLPHKRAFEASPIPDRLYFKIGDVARICDVEPYVLRFWETQFPQLRPSKSGTGQRLYRKRDVELALEIKRLVHGEGYTIPGARQALTQGARAPEPRPILTEPDASSLESAPASLSAALAEVRSELRAIASLLAGTAADTLPRTEPIELPVSEPEADPLPAHHQPRRRHRRLASDVVEMGSLFPV